MVGWMSSLDSTYHLTTQETTTYADSQIFLDRTNQTPYITRPDTHHTHTYARFFFYAPPPDSFPPIPSYPILSYPHHILRTYNSACAWDAGLTFTTCLILKASKELRSKPSICLSTCLPACTFVISHSSGFASKLFAGSRNRGFTWWSTT